MEQPAIESALKNVGRVCLIVGDEFTRLSDALKAFTDSLVEKAVGIKQEEEHYPIVTVRQILDEMYALYAMGEFADQANEPADIPQPRKVTRPPKRTGPVSKANYTANRPPRVARSSCRTIKR